MILRITESESIVHHCTEENSEGFAEFHVPHHRSHPHSRVLPQEVVISPALISDRKFASNPCLLLTQCSGGTATPVAIGNSRSMCLSTVGSTVGPLFGAAIRNLRSDRGLLISEDSLTDEEVNGILSAIRLNEEALGVPPSLQVRCYSWTETCTKLPLCSSQEVFLATWDIRRHLADLPKTPTEQFRGAACTVSPDEEVHT